MMQESTFQIPANSLIFERDPIPRQSFQMQASFWLNHYFCTKGIFLHKPEIKCVSSS